MSVLALYLRKFIMGFAKFGRWADLALGLVVIAAGFAWNSTWMIVAGVVSIFAFAFNLNGWIQKKTLSFAQSRISPRKR